ncbi:47 kDa outer membrane protein precursor [Roseovarius sp. A-2]|uniref:OmpP1/FadL family transporter n=1 Tax=Roseovarius sp. A-2 TaxID=1570360 RepID=UPI0009B513CC|nr:outer membrane protein transport protein [Roseovarius sp. A-2]GAW33895.1 47 kDa outer membrane protein precursor [Roseovarius sp. A-2]
MINSWTRRAAACALVGASLLASPAQATNGYFANGYGGKSKGMAGAGVAVSTGVLGMAQNPAMGVKVGNQAAFCLTTFAPDRDVTIQPGGPLTPGKFKSDNDVFFIPCGGANWQLDDQSSLGLFVFGNGGMNTEFDSNFFAGFGAGSAPLGVNLEQAFFSLNYARQVSDRLSIGVSPILAVQRFKAEGLEAFAPLSVSPGNVTNRGHDWSTGFGVNLGLLYEASPEWTLGAAFRSRIQMSSFDKYRGLFAEGGDFDIPAMVTLGAAYTPAAAPDWTITGEYQRIFYSNINAIANSSVTPGGPLGSAGGIGFGWDDVDILRLAAIWRKSEQLTLRTGVSYSSDFIGNTGDVVINTIAPGTPQWHLSAGASYAINDRWELTFAYTHAFSNGFTGANPTLTGVPQTVRIRMHQHEVTTGFSYRW